MTLTIKDEHRRLYEEYFSVMFPKVKAFVWKIVKREEDAEDIAQDVFVKLCSSAELFEKVMNEGNNYLYAMARNAVFNFIKHKNIENDYAEHTRQADNEADAALSSEVYDHIYEQELKLLVRMALEKMPKQRRKVFLLNRKYGKSNAEIAEMLELSVRTVERHLYLAMVDLKKIIFFCIFLLGR